jgi:hypothetical protein
VGAAGDRLQGIGLTVTGWRPICFYPGGADDGGARVKVEALRRAVTLDEVRAHRDAITRLGERFGVRNIRVFGSVARDEATPTATWTCWSTSSAATATSTWPGSPWASKTNSA